jgi:uncharacterized protein (DUF1778 family)
MMKAILRTKSISTKVTEEEYARLEELAGTTGQSMSEWVRTKLLEQAERKAAKVSEETLLTVAKGEAMTVEQMQTVIERADASKLERAPKLLAAQVPAPEFPSDLKVQ